MSEQRLQPRGNGLLVEPSPAEADALGHLSTDLRMTGLYVNGEGGSLEEGSRVRLTLWMETSTGRCRGVDCAGRVVRVDRKDGATVGLAMEFERVPPDDVEIDDFT